MHSTEPGCRSAGLLQARVISAPSTTGLWRRVGRGAGGRGTEEDGEARAGRGAPLGGLGPGPPATAGCRRAQGSTVSISRSIPKRKIGFDLLNLLMYADLDWSTRFWEFIEQFPDSAFKWGWEPSVKNSRSKLSFSEVPSWVYMSSFFLQVIQSTSHILLHFS